MCLSLMSLGLHGNVKVAHIVCMVGEVVMIVKLRVSLRFRGE